MEGVEVAGTRAFIMKHFLENPGGKRMFGTITGNNNKFKVSKRGMRMWSLFFWFRILTGSQTCLHTVIESGVS
jgi:hypothetical protein